MLGMLFTGVQTLGVFHELSISWIEPLKSMLGYMTLLSFDLKEGFSARYVASHVPWSLDTECCQRLCTCSIVMTCTSCLIY